MRCVTRTFIALVAGAGLLLAACGEGSTDAGQAVAEDVAAVPNEAEEVAPAETADTVTTPPNKAETETQAENQDMADGMTENLEEQQASAGGGNATFTTGNQTWEFDSVLCAFGEEEIGQEGAEFVLSSIQDGLQLYLSIDVQGHSMSLDDVEDFENPSTSLSQADASVDFLVLDGKNVSGEAPVLDWTDDPPTTIQAQVVATCP